MANPPASAPPSITLPVMASSSATYTSAGCSRHHEMNGAVAPLPWPAHLPERPACCASFRSDGWLAAAVCKPRREESCCCRHRLIGRNLRQPGGRARAVSDCSRVCSLRAASRRPRGRGRRRPGVRVHHCIVFVTGRKHLCDDRGVNAEKKNESDPLRHQVLFRNSCVTLRDSRVHPSHHSPPKMTATRMESLSPEAVLLETLRSHFHSVCSAFGTYIAAPEKDPLALPLVASVTLNVVLLCLVLCILPRRPAGAQAASKANGAAAPKVNGTYTAKRSERKKRDPPVITSVAAAIDELRRSAAGTNTSRRASSWTRCARNSPARAARGGGTRGGAGALRTHHSSWRPSSRTARSRRTSACAAAPSATSTAARASSL